MVSTLMLSQGSVAPSYANVVMPQCIANPAAELARLCSACHTLLVAQKSLQACKEAYQL